MKFSFKKLAAAVALAAVATGASAAKIDDGANGNGGLFFNIWDGASSYTLNLSRGLDTALSINSFESILAGAGGINLSWAADDLFVSFLSTADSSKLKWNVLATDNLGDRRVLETYTTATPTANKDTDGNFRTVAGSIMGALKTGDSAVNTKLASADSAIFSSSEVGYFGKAAQGSQFGGNLQSFVNSGTLANNSFETGLNFMRVDAKSGGLALSKFNQYSDNGSAVRVYLDADNTLHIAAVPEPESYAMLLAGLGMIGFMARRRLNNRV